LKTLGTRLLARDFRLEEAELIEASFRELSEFYQEHPDEAKQLLQVGESEPDVSLDLSTLAAWTMLANELMNLDEVLNK